MTTPHHELRAAARLVRDTAAKASADIGPWTVDHHDLWIGGTTWGYRLPVDGNLRPADAAWIALACPPRLAEPLAAWLDDVAEGFEMEPHVEPWTSSEAYALDIARALNESQP